MEHGTGNISISGRALAAPDAVEHDYQLSDMRRTQERRHGAPLHGINLLRRAEAERMDHAMKRVVDMQRGLVAWVSTPWPDTVLLLAGTDRTALSVGAPGLSVPMEKTPV